MKTNQLPENLTTNQVIALDMDGTLEDPWACCGRKDRMGGSETCRHARADILARVANIQAAYPAAALVVLSWRGGCERVTREWLANVGIDVAAVFVPGSADSNAIGAVNAGQVGFKVNVARALAALDIEIVASFDDNVAVVDALRAEGVPALVAPRMVEVLPHEWRAGFLGAPAPATTTELLEQTLASFDSLDLFNSDQGQFALAES